MKALTLIGLIVLLAPGIAHATPGFPGVIKTHLGLPADPACAICHAAGDLEGRGTGDVPFGASLRTRGLLGGDEEALTKALDALDTEKADSDHDGVSDIDELRRGRDPNINEATVGAGAEPPHTGVGAWLSAMRAKLESIPALWMLGGALLLRRRRWIPR